MLARRTDFLTEQQRTLENIKLKNNSFLNTYCCFFHNQQQLINGGGVLISSEGVELKEMQTKIKRASVMIEIDREDNVTERTS